MGEVQRVLSFLVLILLSEPSATAQAQAVPTEFWAIQPWEMWAATPPHVKLCNTNEHCYSLAVVQPDKHILQFQDNARYSVTRVLADGGVGVVRDYGDGGLRCFSDTRDTCAPARFPPGYSPGYDIIPVLNAPAVNTATPGAKMVYVLETEQVNEVDADTCEVAWMGEVVHSGSHFMLASFDFGPGVGVLQNVYVTEEAMGCPRTATAPMACQRLERYFFAPGYGRVRQEGWNDPWCDGVLPWLCTGAYVWATPGVQGWTMGEGGPIERMEEVCTQVQ